jgi:hypothetical protein
MNTNDGIFRLAVASSDLVEHAWRLDDHMAKLKAESGPDAQAFRIQERVRGGANGAATIFNNGMRFGGERTDQREFLATLTESAI